MGLEGNKPKPPAGALSAPFGMRRFAATLCLTLALAALPGLSRAGYLDTPVCRAHLDKIEIQLSQTATTLERAGNECTAMHGHVRVMLAARNVYSRCATGDERLHQVGLMDGSIHEVADRISATCASQ